MQPNALVQHIAEAATRVGQYLSPTALIESPALSERLGAHIVLKAEHRQPTGSFKVRGATNALLSAQQDRLAKGIVTASSGNHGAAVCWAAQRLGVAVEVHVSDHASSSKISNIKRLGGSIMLSDAVLSDIEGHARTTAEQSGRVFVSPYNDAIVIAGQGTTAVELLQQAPDLDAVFITVGGGGLMSGMAMWIKHHQPSVRIYGCLPENSAFMSALVAGKNQDDVIDLPTLSDGSAGRLEDGSITIDLCQAHVDEWVLVSEVEIATAMRDFIDDHHELIEGAAGAAIAAATQRKAEIQGKRVAIILCGANVASGDVRHAIGLAQ
jgi:threonine dehydratase